MKIEEMTEILRGKVLYEDVTSIQRKLNEIADTLEALAEKNKHLLSVAEKMHTWIFLHTIDEQEAYDECGLTDEDNLILGYMGKIQVPSTEEHI